LYLGLFPEAADQISRGFQLDPPQTPVAWYSAGLLRLSMGDEAGSRSICREMLAHFPSNILDVVRLCTLRPDSTADFGAIATRARQALQTRPEGDPRDWGDENLALALFRAGRIDEARRVAENIDRDVVLRWPVLALTLQASGQTDRARDALTHLDRVL
jgi:hypothetical protein